MILLKNIYKLLKLFNDLLHHIHDDDDDGVLLVLRLYVHPSLQSNQTLTEGIRRYFAIEKPYFLK